MSLQVNASRKGFGETAITLLIELMLKSNPIVKEILDISKLGIDCVSHNVGWPSMIFNFLLSTFPLYRKLFGKFFSSKIFACKGIVFLI